MDEHRAAFAYDWRTRFGLPLAALRDGRMTLVEANDLTQELLSDPSSHVAAAVGGLKHPFSQESFILADLFDLMQYTNADPKKRSSVKPYPRPFDAKKASGRRSKKPTATQEQIDAALAARGH